MGALTAEARVLVSRVCAAAEWVVMVGLGFSLCWPWVISRDQTFLMSTGSSGGTQASHSALPTPDLTQAENI